MDYAYEKIKLSENQKFFCGMVEQKQGRCDSIGVDFGGWTAHNKIVTALKKKGVMVQDDENRYVLIVGEPVVPPDPKFGKPYMKVKKELITMYNGFEFEEFDAQIYLDPRGDVEFHIIMPFNVGTLMKLQDRAKRHSIDQIDYLVACGASAQEAINNATNLTTEYRLIADAELVKVIHVLFKTSTAAPNTPYKDTGLAFQYYKVLQSSKDKALYIVDKKGVLRQFKSHESEHNGITIPWTEDRETALENLRLKLEAAGCELRKILFAKTFIKMLDSNTQLKLEG